MPYEAALLAWLQQVLELPSLQKQDLLKPLTFYSLASKLPKMNLDGFQKFEDEIATWQNRYSNFKYLYRQIESYYHDELNALLPVGLPAINLLSMSKGEDQQSLDTLMIILFIACIESASKQEFITHIMSLEEGSQMELMNLIQEKSLNKNESAGQLMAVDTEAQQSIQKNRIDELYFKMQGLYSENEALNRELSSHSEEKAKLNKLIKELKEENNKLKRDFDQKVLQLQQKQQQEMQQEFSKQTLTDTNEEVITLLKKQLLNAEQKHFREKSKLNEQMEELKEQLFLMREKTSELESESLVNITRKVNHDNCININEHKNVIKKLQMKIQSREQREVELEREKLALKYEIDEMERKFKKEERENKTIREEIDKKKNAGPMVNVKDARELQAFVLTAVRDNLAKKLEAEKSLIK